MKKNISIIIPILNEEKNLSDLIFRINDALHNNGIEYEIIFVDDHSQDNSLNLIENLSRQYPIRVHIKNGKRGKAYSIMEGIEFAKYELLAIIDGDLQYPPEAIPEMVDMSEKYGIVVANRMTSEETLLRRFGSRVNAILLGKFLLGLDCDIQSGLKVFKKEIAQLLDTSMVSQWTFDIPLLQTALDTGNTIGTVNIAFSKRMKGESKVNIISTAIEIIKAGAISRFKDGTVYFITPTVLKQSQSTSVTNNDKPYHNQSNVDTAFILNAFGNNTTKDTGFIYKGKHYITHNRLPITQSAINPIVLWQKIALIIIASVFIVSLFVDPKITIIAFISIITAVYFIDFVFATIITHTSLRTRAEITIDTDEIAKVTDVQLPTYTILCPLYNEWEVLPQFVKAIERIEWPHEKLEVLLLLEEDDQRTLVEARKLALPSYFTIVIVPNSYPKTKPKACNYGLTLAHGEYVVIYDAEDIPDTLQLKKSYLGFKKVSGDVFCLQAKLNYYNPNDNILTRLFTAEYALWFEMILPGLQMMDAVIPLGGTSNHFRTEDLRKLHGWDAFNVTEDCDLGVRIFKMGYRTAILDSVTLEEANGDLKNWLRQRSRWIKGYLQTYFVHMRTPLTFFKERKWKMLYFQLTVGGKILFSIINPLLWIITISYFVFNAFVGDIIESLFPAPVFYVAAITLVFGNFIYLYDYMIGSAKRERWEIIKYILVIPFYWILISVGTIIAIKQFIVKPHYWEKTNHGLSKNSSAIRKSIIPLSFGSALRATRSSLFSSAGFFVAATVLFNILGFSYNAILIRFLSLEVYGLISLFSSLLFIINIPLDTLSLTISHTIAYYSGRYKTNAPSFYQSLQSKSLLIGSTISLLWAVGIPFFIKYINVSSYLGVVLLTPVWLIITLSSIKNGYISGNLRLSLIGFALIVEGVVKIGVSSLLLAINKPDLIYASIPLSLVSSFIVYHVASIYIPRQAPDPKLLSNIKFPKKFFTRALIIKISAAVFLNLDMLFANRFLNAVDVGEYALLSLSGKMIFLSGFLFIQLTVPIISKKAGEKSALRILFYRLLFLSIISSTLVYFLTTTFPEVVTPFITGATGIGVQRFITSYGFGILCFTVAYAFALYYAVREISMPAVTLLLSSITATIAMLLYGNTIESLVKIIQYFGAGTLGLLLLSFFIIETQQFFVSQLKYFLFLINPPASLFSVNNDSTKIIIFNWRDITHQWAGGAEVYIQELAQRMVTKGMFITLLCGNDGTQPLMSIKNNYRIIRLGGFYTVYFWTLIFYVIHLKFRYDIVIDSENGVPFFTPLFAGVPVIGLIHHVHLDIFTTNLRFPLSTIARFLESTLMPIIYRNTRMITVSQSSKASMEKLGLGRNQPIDIIVPGVDTTVFKPGFKTTHPQILYLGRLKPYKSIETLLYAMQVLIYKIPEARLIIAGSGENRGTLEKLVAELGIKKFVTFTGKVQENLKRKLMSESWVFAYPSSLEGWGMAVIEANASGTPVVASDVPGLRDSVRNPTNGFLVPYGDSDAFAEKIEKIITDKSLRLALNINSHKWARNFNWDISVIKLEKIIKNSVWLTDKSLNQNVKFGNVNQL